MYLNSYLPLVRRDAGYVGLRDRLATEGHARFATFEAAKPAMLAALHVELARPTILLVSRMARARQLAEEVGLWIGASEVLHLFPELDPLPYERLAPDAEHLYDRVRAMLALSQPYDHDRGANAPLVIVTARGALARIMDPETCRSSTWRLKVGERIRPDRLVAEWVAAGYEPVSLVEGPGEFARRGGILDIFPTGLQATTRVQRREPDARTESTRVDAAPAQPAFRIELWGNDVDSIRTFDPATQRSGESVEEILMGPAHEVRPVLPDGAESLLAKLDRSRASERVRNEIEDELRILRDG